MKSQVFTHKTGGVTAVYSMPEDNISERVQEMQTERLKYNTELLIAGNVDIWYEY